MLTLSTQAETEEAQNLDCLLQVCRRLAGGNRRDPLCGSLQQRVWGLGPHIVNGDTLPCLSLWALHLGRCGWSGEIADASMRRSGALNSEK